MTRDFWIKPGTHGNAIIQTPTLTLYGDNAETKRILDRFNMWDSWWEKDITPLIHRGSIRFGTGHIDTSPELITLDTLSGYTVIPATRETLDYFLTSLRVILLNHTNRNSYKLGDKRGNPLGILEHNQEAYDLNKRMAELEHSDWKLHPTHRSEWWACANRMYTLITLDQSRQDAKRNQRLAESTTP